MAATCGRWKARRFPQTVQVHARVRKQSCALQTGILRLLSRWDWDLCCSLWALHVRKDLEGVPTRRCACGVCLCRSSVSTAVLGLVRQCKLAPPFRHVLGALVFVTASFVHRREISLLLSNCATFWTLSRKTSSVTCIISTGSKDLCPSLAQAFAIYTLLKSRVPQQRTISIAVGAVGPHMRWMKSLKSGCLRQFLGYSATWTIHGTSIFLRNDLLTQSSINTSRILRRS